MSETDPAIIYFGNDWFAENRTSSHHVARRLAMSHRLIYVECPGLRAPKATGRDLKKLLAKLFRFAAGATTRDGDITVFTLPQLPLHRFRVVRWLNRVLGTIALRLLFFRLNIATRITWFVVPHVAHLCGRLGEALSVYYCIDDYAALPDVDITTIQTMDDELTRQAGVVFVASDTLLESKRAMNSITYHSPHGVDVEHFAAARRLDGPTPADVAALPRPIVGFHGLIERWIDLDLVEYLARARPQYSFVMIGRVAVPETEIPQLPNLHFIGRRSYDELPAYGRAFRCCIIPYRLTRQVMHANPLKLREYLAMGKPVVAVSTPEIDQFSDIVAVACDREEFLEKLDLAMTSAPAAEETERRIRRVEPMSWEARVEDVWSIVRAQMSAHGINAHAAEPV